MKNATTETVRVLVALDVPAKQATDIDDLIASVTARVEGEAGYLDDGDPVMPTAVTVAIVGDEGPLTADDLRGIYEVGAGF